ncbi:uncharacterized protein LOC106089869 [Stomoxys calcitrans]|uniref:uncharacterized protein LOC106089869 n=1 Tax=Stomoxys calcitrans TaxID=35570 RepID=UPI0027E350B7|nr:uncharacterized protein LOC106089869 [Stomoxys calcitrans]
MPSKFFFCIVAVICASYLEVSAVSLIYGYLNPADVVIGSEFVHGKAEGVFHSIFKKTVKFPKEGKQNDVPITGIHVMDLGRPNNIAYNFLRDGGPGKTYATIEVMSQKDKPVNMKIIFYGLHAANSTSHSTS